MLEIYIDHDQDLSFAIFVIDEKSCKKVLTHIKQNFGYTLEKSEEDIESFSDVGEFLNNTLLIKYKDVTEDFLEIASKIHLHIVP
jgi:hypothetical protein